MRTVRRASGPSAAPARSRTSATNAWKRSQVIAVAQVGSLQEGVAPGALGIAALLAPPAAGLLAERDRLGHLRADLATALEAQDEQRLAAGRGVRERRLAGVEQAAVGREEARLGERPHRLGALLEAVEQHRGRLLEARRLLHAHPGLGDHAEDALGADQHPVGARA